jgi:hypothetical protein
VRFTDKHIAKINNVREDGRIEPWRRAAYVRCTRLPGRSVGGFGYGRTSGATPTATMTFTQARNPLSREPRLGIPLLLISLRRPARPSEPFSNFTLRVRGSSDYDVTSVQYW